MLKQLNDWACDKLIGALQNLIGFSVKQLRSMELHARTQGAFDAAVRFQEAANLVEQSGTELASC